MNWGSCPCGGKASLRVYFLYSCLLQTKQCHLKICYLQNVPKCLILCICARVQCVCIFQLISSVPCFLRLFLLLSFSWDFLISLFQDFFLASCRLLRFPHFLVLRLIFQLIACSWNCHQLLEALWQGFDEGRHIGHQVQFLFSLQRWSISLFLSCLWFQGGRGPSQSGQPHPWRSQPEQAKPLWPWRIECSLEGRLCNSLKLQKDQNGPWNWSHQFGPKMIEWKWSEHENKWYLIFVLGSTNSNLLEDTPFCNLYNIQNRV